MGSGLPFPIYPKSNLIWEFKIPDQQGNYKAMPEQT